MSTPNGKMVIICAPSGSGKTTIVRALLQRLTTLEFSVSACSRPAREGETDGKDYYFLSKEIFEQKIKEGAFLEWEEVYTGSYYGTLLSELRRIWDRGKCVVFDVDVLGGINIKKKYPGNSLAIFIMPPSINELARRLTARGTESRESIEKRMERAEYEIDFADQFDFQVVNDNLETAIEDCRRAIESFLNNDGNDE